METKTARLPRQVLERTRLRAVLTALSTALLCSGLGGCLMIGGSSRGGFFLWPGGLGFFLIIALFFFLSRRR